VAGNLPPSSAEVKNRMSCTSTPQYALYFHILLTPWCRVLLEKLTVLQLVKKFPAFHGTRSFITALTSVRHLSLSWASPIQSIFTYAYHYCATVHVPTSNYSLNFYLKILIQPIFLLSYLRSSNAFQPRCVRLHLYYRISSQALSHSRKKRLLLLLFPSVCPSLPLFASYHPNSLEVIPTLMQWRY